MLHPWTGKKIMVAGVEATCSNVIKEKTFSKRRPAFRTYVYYRLKNGYAGRADRRLCLLIVPKPTV